MVRRSIEQQQQQRWAAQLSYSSALPPSTPPPPPLQDCYLSPDLCSSLSPGCSLCDWAGTCLSCQYFHDLINNACPSQPCSAYIQVGILSASPAPPPFFVSFCPHPPAL